MSNIVTKSLMNKLIILFLAVSIIPIALVGYISYASGKAAIQKTFTDSFTALSEGKEMVILEYLEGGLEIVGATARNRFIQESVEKINRAALDKDKVVGEIELELTEIKEIDKHINEIFILNPEGRIIASSDKGTIGQDKSKDPYFLGGKEGPFIKDAYFSESTKKNVFAFAAPIKKEGTQEFLGVLVVHVDLGHLNELTTGNIEGLGKTGETYIVNKDGYMLTESRFIKDTTLKQRVDTEPVKLFYNKKEIMAGVYRDYRGELVVGASMGDEIAKAFPLLGWMILAEIDASEAFRPVRALAMKTTLFSLLMAALIAFIAFLAAQAIAKPIKRLSEQAVKVGEGDLTQEIEETKREDEVGLLHNSFRQMIISLRDLVSQAASIADSVSSSSQQLSSTAQEMNVATEEVSTTIQQIAKGTETQAQKIEETKKVMEEIAASASQVAKGAQDGAGYGVKTVDAAKKSGDTLKETLQEIEKIYEAMTASNVAVKKIAERSEQIGEIVNIITGVADQTNLLALNAAIEAARAGEYGRGFAVVAVEVRKLAESSAKSAEEIGKIIKEFNKESGQVISNMEESSKGTNTIGEMSGKIGEALTIIIKNTESLAAMIEEVAASNEQQVAGTTQASRVVADIASVAEETAAAAQQATASTEEMTAFMEQLAASAQDLADMGISLKDTVAKFKIGGEARKEEIVKSAKKTIVPDRMEQLRKKTERLKERYSDLKTKKLEPTATDSHVEKINFQLAKSKHALWKTRMWSFLNDEGNIGEAELSSPHECDLGKWLDKVGMPKFGKIPQMHELEKAHKQFHALIAQIVGLKKSGDISGAKEEFKRLEPESQKMLALLDSIEKRV